MIKNNNKLIIMNPIFLKVLQLFLLIVLFYLIYLFFKKKKNFISNKPLQIITIFLTSLITYFLISFFVISVYFYQPNIEFNKKEWIINNDFQINNNPRKQMVSDIIKNILKKEMSKSEVENYLGKSKKEVISKLNNSAIRPDSVKIGDQNYNKWYKQNSKEITILKYILGSTLGNYQFLIIQIDKNDLVIDYWVEKS